jgi:hypothetical protein
MSTSAHAQLSGTYTVCASGCDYNTIQKAADDLKSQGISNSVVISIKPGFYNESVLIGKITGTSASHTVTFKGAGSTNTDVEIAYDTLCPLTLFNTDHVIIENLFLQRNSYASKSYTLDIQLSKEIAIVNCKIFTAYSWFYEKLHYPVYLFKDSSLSITNCHIRGGYSGIGDGGGGYNKRLTIKNNLITKAYYHGIYLSRTAWAKYLSNTIDSPFLSIGEYGIYNDFATDTTVIKGNYTNYADFGLYAYNSGVLIIDSNIVEGSRNGIWAYSYPSSDIFITRNYVRDYYFNGIIAETNANGYVVNNIINGGAKISNSYGIMAQTYDSGSWLIAHNTINPDSGSLGLYFYTPYPSTKVEIVNNLIQGAGSSYSLYGLAKGHHVDGNNLYPISPGSYGTINLNSYSTFTGVQNALKLITGYGLNEQNSQVNFKSSTDFHLDHSNPAPFGVKTDIKKDIDGDDRCQLMPTVGADETKNTSGDNFKKLSGTKFTGPSKSYIGTPTIFYNSGSSRLRYRWYVNGKKVSDSFHLYTTALTYPKTCIKLEAYNCASVDSFVSCVTVDSPTVAPTTDFIADNTTIRQGDTASFTDLSSGNPSAWTWKITPDKAVVGGTLINTYTYLAGNANTPSTKVRFDVPGKYKVCLTASNVRGMGNTECKTDYIEVQTAITMQPGLQTATTSSGYIFDNGGPAGNTQTAYYYSNLPKVLIDACADSVYLVFKSFNMNCGYEYVRVYEGKDKQTGKALTCTGNMQFGAYGPGLTGSATSLSCSQNCPPGHKTSTGSFVCDTFKAAKYMYIEMESNNPGSPGFEAYYWTKPSSLAKPKASFTSVDSLCLNHTAYITNTTTGTDITNYTWYINGSYEGNTKNPTPWPFFVTGKYTITLFATNCGGTDSFSKVITVYYPRPPVTSFIADNKTPTTSDVVFLSTNMPMCVLDYKWRITPDSGVSGSAVFVNGTKSTSANPELMFTDTGCYTVSLYTKNASGEDSLRLPCYIKVRGPYCTPGTINKAVDIGISEVIFNTIDNKTAQGTTSYTSYVNDHALSTTVQKGEVHELTLARTTNSNKISRAAWIDWNIDGVFDTTERVGMQTNSLTLSWTTNVHIPKSAKSGATVLRVAVNQGSQTNIPCGPNAYGEYEDYRVYVSDDVTKPVMTLLGDDTVYVDQCTTYIDSGATAWDNADGNITSKISASTNPAFNNYIQGTYVRTYRVYDSAFNLGQIKRIIIVKPDKTPPDITVYGPDTVYQDVFQSFLPDSAVAYDCGNSNPIAVTTTYSVDITKIGIYTVQFSATDQSGNKTVKNQVVIVRDRTAPTLKLKGNNAVILDVGSAYNDSGVTISDNYYSEAELRTLLVMSSNVDALKLGTYTVVYTLTDPSGNGPVTVTRTVIVVDRKPPFVSVIGQNPYLLDLNTQFNDPGVTISDNYDNITHWDTAGTFYATFPTGFANKLGTYTVLYVVSDNSGNTAVAARTVVVQDTTTSIKTRYRNPADAGVSIYPNPSSGKFRIAFSAPHTESVSLSVSNSLGQEVSAATEVNLNMGAFDIDLSNQPAGIYFVNIRSDKDCVAKPVLIRR